MGFAFGDAILLDVHEVSADVYTGKVRGETVRFTVNADRSVTFQRGERLYGPYTAAEDPTAVPADSALAAYMTAWSFAAAARLCSAAACWKTAACICSTARTAALRTSAASTRPAITPQTRAEAPSPKSRPS